MQLKKRSQEKEKRIRLALLGLAPQVVARHADDATRRQQQQQQATPADLSVGSVRRISKFHTLLGCLLLLTIFNYLFVDITAAYVLFRHLLPHGR